MPRAKADKTPKPPTAPIVTPDDAAIDDTADFHPLYLAPEEIILPAGELPVVRPGTMGGTPAEDAR